ncbi:carbon-monoxide dehydrogenase small subunit [Halarchaeum solikamskense]|uniref:(2Fe-2S)-binding protein n=1 Tax=Halarchaeum nitratireducens TaxID=489913 RepID=UPI001B3A9647|nr:(2Fe-2S)-binding protein [Halarchaeum solikamskense]MBP2252484.1 carbon-monoxide dehydrogenase small subunit [Halarchaeum solikamskense]
MDGNDGSAGTVSVRVNGEPVTLAAERGETLIESLRNAGHYEVKNGCDEGVCGSCNVLCDGELTRACLTPASRCDGADVTTVKGLLDDDGLHALQEEFLEHGAAQCGFCIPGVLVAAYHLLQRTTDPSDAEIADALSGNVCRCTGYAQQIEAIRDAATRLDRAEPMEVER